MKIIIIFFKLFIIVLFSVSLAAIIIIFYIIYPIIKDYTELQDLRNYYSICAAISGVSLGLFYYFHKILLERSKRNQAKRNKRIELVLEELNNINHGVIPILTCQYENPANLRQLRFSIRQSFEIIILIIKEKKVKIDLSRVEINEVIDLYSFVDNSSKIMESMGLKKIKISVLQNEIEAFIDKMKIARKTCFLKII